MTRSSSNPERLGLVRWLGILLIVQGALGLLLALLGFTSLAAPLARAERVSMTVQSAASAAATAFEGFDTSLDQARTSASSAGNLAREVSATVDGLAAAMAISILGAQPLLPLQGQFRQSAEQLQLLGDEIDKIGSSLQVNRTEVRQVSDELRALSDELKAGNAGNGIPPSLLVYAFLAWIALLAATSVVAGVLLVRQPR
ncbi:MAG: hypothetical protein M3R49_01035 [Chloroflexota bacterium]|nr:hypothetical protein [Chloroflexota bacterium]